MPKLSRMSVEPFAIAVPEEVLDDLRERLARVRWPDQLDGPGWDDGTSAPWLGELVAHWGSSFDWRAQEAQINRFGHYRATITDPAAYGGDPADAFDVVIPSLPGYAFSDPIPGRGSARRTPALWAQLMRDVLGYDRFAAHGGDIGAMVTNRLALEFAAHVIGIHVAMVAEPFVGAGAASLTAAEQTMLADRALGQERGGAYAHVQRTRPQALAFALMDSPVRLAAWSSIAGGIGATATAIWSAASPRISC